jgi:two-component system sensor histidine kinase KdpD
MDKNIDFHYLNKPSSLIHYSLAVLAILTVTFICFLIKSVIGYQSVAFILLLTVSVLPLFFQAGPVIAAAGTSALLWNFLFIPPLFTFHIDRLEDALLFSMYFIIAIITGVLTSRTRFQERVALYREERTKAVYTLTRELSVITTLEQVINTSVKNIKIFFNAETLIILAEHGKLNNNAHPKSSFSINKKEFGIAGWCFENNKKAGKFTEILSSAQAIYYPLSTPRMILGVIGIDLKSNLLKPEQETLLETFIFQIASSMERELLDEKAKKAMLIEESEKLQTTLLNSISHELRTPLVTIMGAASSLFDKNNSDNPEIRKELNSEIYLASERLNRLVANLLDMSRLESGNLKLKLKLHDINDLIKAVLADLKTELTGHIVKFKIIEDLPLIKIDFGLMEQALSNIIINSAIYTPPASVIEINVSNQENELIIEISDNGPGLAEDTIIKIFDKFYRAPGTRTGGTGIGLSIVKGFIEAHGGSISLENNITGGLKFIIRLYFL